MSEEVKAPEQQGETEEEAYKRITNEHAFALRGMALHLMELSGQVELIKEVLDELISTLQPGEEEKPSGDA